MVGSILATDPTSTTELARELVLRVCGTSRDGQVVRLKAPKCTVGAGADCTLRLKARGVQPLHCLILRGPAGMVVRRYADDTFLNGRPFTDAALTPGDHLRVGPVEFEVLPDSETAASSRPAFPGRSDELDALRNQLNTLRERLQQQQTTLEHEQHQWRCQREADEAEIVQSRQKLDAEIEELRQRQAEFDRRREEFEELHAIGQTECQQWQRQFDERDHELKTRREDVDARWTELEQRRTAFDEERLQWQSRRNEREAQLEERQRQFNELQTKLDSETEQLQHQQRQWQNDREETERQLHELQENLNARAAELDKQRHAFDEQQRQWQTQRDADQQQLANSADQELERQRAELESLREEFETQRTDFETRQAEWQHERQQFEEDRARAEQEQQQWDEQRRLWDEQRRQAEEASAQRCSEETTSDEAALATQRNELNAERDALAAESEAWLAERERAEQELAQRAEQLDARTTDLDSQGRAREDERRHWDAERELIEGRLREQTEQMEKRQAELQQWEVELRERCDQLERAAAEDTRVAEAEQPETKDEALDLESVLRRLGHSELLDEDEEAEPEGSTAITTELSATEASAPDSYSQAAEPQPTTGRDDEDESIDEYMARLMNRVKGMAGDTPVRPVKATVVSEPAPVETQEASPASHQLPPENRQPAEAMAPRAVAPEKRVSLAAMRELANLSARTAVDRHARDQLNRSRQGKLTVAAVALFTGFVLIGMWFWFNAINLTFYSGLAAIIVSLIWFIRYAFQTGRLKVNEAGHLDWHSNPEPLQVEGDDPGDQTANTDNVADSATDNNLAQPSGENEAPQKPGDFSTFEQDIEELVENSAAKAPAED